ncbi:malonyl CoA-acyl carrier protein transacylase [Ammonifex degensii KC4]|uniref:Malonyl CoA-acyl carrier protein transacylase n=1 Tax=Ammonifex degensii (strain DSM 10501 / KC4) TaxID=429009 RepID=C9RCW5_AMMDK|nr:ACP S-malonyltransferase [Ammonifex degensii]ACX52092.1 malonyl CoA-acyl carrier protein transacylase [Ammonifex degensii KC4]
MTLACVFPGQGSQYVGMGKDLYERYPEAREVFAEADAVLGFPLSQLCFEGPASLLSQTMNTQPAVLTVSVACWRVYLTQGGRKPSAVAGHSLGEFSALVAAGALDFPTALRLVRRRGELMQEAVPLGEGGMLALLGLPTEKLERVLEAGKQAGVVEVANYNCPGQIVLSGHMPALEAAAQAARAEGAKKTVLLAVSGPFHSSLMRRAAELFAQELEQVTIKKPVLPVVLNCTAEYAYRASEIKKALMRQMTSPVRWEESVRRLVKDGVETFVEIGPGKVLTGLIRRIHALATCLNVEDEASLRHTLRVLTEGKE